MCLYQLFAIKIVFAAVLVQGIAEIRYYAAQQIMLT